MRENANVKADREPNETTVTAADAEVANRQN